MSLTNLLPLAKNFDDARILCIGDIMLDHFVYGRVDRISPEAPIPVLHVNKRLSMLGGAGNAARNMQSLGATVAFVGVVGDDQAGRDIARLIEESDGGGKPMRPELIVDAGRCTIVKTRYVAQGQQLLRCDEEVTQPVSAGVLDQIVGKVEEQLHNVDVMVISDYGKGLLTPALLRRVIALAEAAGVPVVVDPKGHDYRKYAGATAITPNLNELSVVSGIQVREANEIVNVARKLIADAGIANVVATRSADGVSLIEKNGNVSHFPAHAREVFDVSGAGDTLVAALACVLASQGSLVDAVRYANLAAGVAVGKMGTATVTRDEVELELRKVGEGREASAKMADWSAAGLQVRAWRAAGLTVGFTNGCFDLLHPGHVAVLEGARRECDRLIVAVNADASVKRLKGPSRPIQDEIQRATMLAALSCVDLVVIFEQDDPGELIGRLLPDVLVKGGDYRPDDIVGAEVVRSHGGRVVVVPLVNGMSTTSIIARING